VKCGECERDFPPELLDEMFIGGRYTTLICGICALKLRNQYLGLPPSTPFVGSNAQKMYKKALEYLQKKGKKS